MIKDNVRKLKTVDKEEGYFCHVYLFHYYSYLLLFLYSLQFLMIENKIYINSS